jgi:hypothetical protein
VKNACFQLILGAYRMPERGETISRVPAEPKVCQISSGEQQCGRFALDCGEPSSNWSYSSRFPPAGATRSCQRHSDRALRGLVLHPGWSPIRDSCSC